MNEEEKIEKIALRLADLLKMDIRMISNPVLEYLDIGYKPFRKKVIELMEERNLTNQALRYLIKITLRFAGVADAPVKLSSIPP